MAGEDEFATVLGQIREGLARLGASALLRADPVALALYADLARCEEMEALNAGLDRLADRLDELIVARTGDPGDSRAARRIAGTARRAGTTAGAETAAVREAPRARTFLRL